MLSKAHTAEEFAEYEKTMPLQFVPNEVLMNERITKMRQLRGWSVRTFWGKMGTGTRPPPHFTFGCSISLLYRASVVLGVSVDYLLGKTYMDDTTVGPTTPAKMTVPRSLTRSELYMLLQEHSRFRKYYSPIRIKKSEPSS